MLERYGRGGFVALLVALVAPLSGCGPLPAQPGDGGDARSDRDAGIAPRSDATGPGEGGVTPPPAAGIEIAAAQTSLSVGQSARLVATVRGADGAPLADARVSWTSTDASIAAVDGAGQVVAVHAGTATIRASAGAHHAERTVTVTPLVPAPCTPAERATGMGWNGTYDFEVWAQGPSFVAAGSTLDLNAGARPAGGGSAPDLSIEAVAAPEGATAAVVMPADDPNYRRVRVTTAATTPLGVRALRLRVASGGVAREVCHPVFVVPAPVAPTRLPGAAPPIAPAVLARWEQNMTTEGARLCNREQILMLGPHDSSVQYYDGARVFYQIGDYTRDAARWGACAGYVHEAYRDGYLIPNDGGLPGWRIFPHGIGMDLTRHMTAASQRALEMFWARFHSEWVLRYGVPDTASREMAYALNVLLEGERALGRPRSEWAALLANYALGHLDQWFMSDRNADIAPFMTGLTAEALIDYHARTGDARVPLYLQAALDRMWSEAWLPAQRAFYYRREEGREPAADLNLLIAPAYAWLYRVTGDPRYLERADQIFAGGVEGTSYWGGKQFSQNYRWSFRYLEWRAAAP